MIHRLELRRIKRLERLRRRTGKSSPGAVKRTIEQLARQSTEIWNALLSSSAALAIDRWAGSTLGAAKTPYDAAMDAMYNFLHDGGSWHRLFDGSHDVLGAWQAVRDAYPNDRFVEEFQGYVTGLWNDLITPNGLPLLTLNKESFDGILEALKSVGIHPDYVRDAVSFTGSEFLGGVAGLVVILLATKRQDEALYWEIAGSLGLTGIAAGNPIAVAAALYAAYLGLQEERLDRTAPLKKHLAEISSNLAIGAAGAVGGTLGAICGGTVGSIPGAIVGAAAGGMGAGMTARKLLRSRQARSIEQQEAIIAIAMLGTAVEARTVLPAPA